MEENSLTLKQYFSVFIKFWKIFVCIILAVIILTTATLFFINKLSNKDKYITITTKNDIDLISYLDTEKSILAKQSIIEFLQDKKDIELEKEIKKLTSAIGIETTKNKDIGDATAYNVIVSSTNGYNDSEIENFLKVYIDNLDKHFVDPNNNLSLINNYKGGQEFSIFSNEINKEYLLYLLDLSNAISNLNNNIDKFENAFTKPSIKNSNGKEITYTFLFDNELNKIKNELSKVLGDIKDNNTLKNIVEKLVKDGSSNVDYLTNLANYQAIDTDSINNLIQDITLVDAQKNPALYQELQDKKLELGYKYTNYVYNQDVLARAIANASTSPISNETIDLIKTLVSSYNKQLNNYNKLLEEYATTSNIIELKKISSKNRFSLKEFAIYNVILAIFTFVIIYVICFIKLQKQGFFEIDEENKNIENLN